MSDKLRFAVAGLPESELDSFISDNQDYQPVMCEQLNGLIAHLVDSQAVLFCVSDAVPKWQDYIVACKTNPATRRIPVVLLASSERQSLPVEIDVIVSVDELPIKISDVIQTVVSDTLSTDCSQPLPAQAIEAIQLFNQGEYYKQHDLLEALWMETPSSVRDLYQAILQVGIAYYQIERSNYRGALKMLLRALQWLNKLPDQCQQVDVAQLRIDAGNVRREVENVLQGKQETIDPNVLKPVQLIET